MGDDELEGEVADVRLMTRVLSRSSLIMLPSGFSGWKGSPLASRLLAMDSSWATLAGLAAVVTGCFLKLLISTSFTDWAPVGKIKVFARLEPVSISETLEI